MREVLLLLINGVSYCKNTSTLNNILDLLYLVNYSKEKYNNKTTLFILKLGMLCLFFRLCIFAIFNCSDLQISQKFQSNTLAQAYLSDIIITLLINMNSSKERLTYLYNSNSESNTKKGMTDNPSNVDLCAKRGTLSIKI